jgi:hypothetical protein
MTDDDWSNLTHWLKLPDAARHPIENELDLYRRVAESAASPPSETRKKLEHAASAVDKVLELIEGFGPDEHSAFVEREGPTPRLDALKLLVKQHAELTAVRDRIATAAGKPQRGKTGSDASNARALVRRVSEIVETYIGTPLNKGKPELDFAEKLGKLAEPQVSIYSIKGAIENLASKKLAAENSANSG